MKHVSFFLLFLVVLVSQSSAQVDPAIASDGSLGTEFLIAIPPNELNPYPTDNIDIVVSSPYTTEFTVTDYSSDKETTYKLAAGSQRVISTATGDANWGWELQNISEEVVRRAIGISSKKPVTVTVVNSKTVTSDSYLALPVSEWGTSYIPCSFYDFREVRNWAGGFVIIASEDQTEINVLLRGEGERDGKTAAGQKINTGVPHKVLLNKGEVYVVKGDGLTRAVFDLSGSLISADKPIGCISFHERTTMPNMLVNGNGRNHLVEMNYPTDRWEKEFVSIEFKRESTNGIGKGDLFRVIAAEDNTKWDVVSYDLTTKRIRSRAGGVLRKAGEIATIASTPSPIELLSGVCIWKADKPIQVVQYSTSSSYDGDPIQDPFMINLVPAARYAAALISPRGTYTSKFPKMYLNVIVLVDSNSVSVEEDLKSIELNGIPIWKHPNSIEPALLLSQIPDTYIYSARIQAGYSSGADISGILTSNGNVRLAGYHYAFGSVDALGTSLGGLNRIIEDPDVIDTTAPEIRVASTTRGQFSITTEDPILYSTEIEQLGLFDISEGTITTGLTKSRSKMIVATAKNRKLMATATLVATDAWGNQSSKTIEYIPSAFSLSRLSIVDTTRVTKPLTVQYNFKVLSELPEQVLGISVENIKNGSIVATVLPLPVPLTDSDSLTLEVVVSSNKAGTVTGNLVVVTEYDTITAPISVSVKDTVPVSSVNEFQEAASCIRIVQGASSITATPEVIWLTATVRDINGRTIKEINNSNQQPSVTIETLPGGVYILTFKTESQVLNTKFSIQR